MDTRNENGNKVQYVGVCCGSSIWSAAFWGILLVILGGLGLLSNVLPFQQLARYIVPGFFVLWGGYILLRLRQFRS